MSKQSDETNGLTVGKADNSENCFLHRKRIRFRNLRQSGTDFAFERWDVLFSQKMMRSSDGSLPPADRFVRLPVVGPGKVDNFFCLFGHALHLLEYFLEIVYHRSHPGQVLDPFAAEKVDAYMTVPVKIVETN